MDVSGQDSSNDASWQGPYYCGVGYDVCFGREICEEHLDVCLSAGLTVGGINGEVLPPLARPAYDPSK
jgi:hypothetical protein